MPNKEACLSKSTPTRTPWNKGKLIGAKPPLRPKHAWSIRTHLMIERRTRDLAMFNLAIDSKLRCCDVALPPFDVPFVLGVVRDLVLAAITEELVVRGWLYTGLRAMLGAWPTIVITSVLFALLHFNVQAILATLPLGLAAGYLPRAHRQHQGADRVAPVPQCDCDRPGDGPRARLDHSPPGRSPRSGEMSGVGGPGGQTLAPARTLPGSSSRSARQAAAIMLDVFSALSSRGRAQGELDHRARRSRPCQP